VSFRAYRCLPILLLAASLCHAQEASKPKAAPLPGKRIWDVAVVPVPAKPVARDVLWGKGLPAKMKVAPDLPRVVDTITAKEYLVALVGKDKVPIPATPDVCRAVILLDQAVVTKADAERLRAFVTAGGNVIAFGHASMLEPDGKIQADYLLADLFGARCGGREKSEADRSPVTFSADSVWGGTYVPENIVDGGKSFWASEDAPMPHWVRMDFSSPRTIARVDVTCRSSNFMLVDFDIQTLRGDKWETLASVRGNDEVKVSCVLDKPVQVGNLRILVKKESLNGNDRIIADIGEVEPYDPEGGKIIPVPYSIEARITDKAWAKLNRSPRLVFCSPAVRIKPDSARPIAVFQGADGSEMPLCTVNDVGKGKAYLFAVPEATLCAEAEQWEVLLRSFVGMPAVRHSGDEKFLVELAKADGRRLVRITDRDAERAAQAKDRKIFVRVNCKVLGPVSSVELLPGGELKTKARGDWVQFRLPLQATATVRLE